MGVSKPPDRNRDSDTPAGAEAPRDGKSWWRGRVDNWFGRSLHDVSQVTLKLENPTTSEAEATGAVMAHVLSRPDSIRQRAQNAATISGALAVALVAAAVTGLTDEGESYRQWTTLLVCGAILGFAISTLLSVYAVVFPHNRGKKDEQDYNDLVKEYEDYADEVRQKMRWAATATAVALLLTTAAVVTEIAERSSTNFESMDLVLTPEAMSAVEMLCRWDGKLAPQIYGSLGEDELAKDIVEVKDLSHPSVSSMCKGKVRLSRKSIRAAKAAD